MNINELKNKVLILVLMEDTLRDGNRLFYSKP